MISAFRSVKDLFLAAAAVFCLAAQADSPFEIQEVDPDIGVGRAVEIVDMNGDGKLDVLALTDTEVLWYENPSWTKKQIAAELDGTHICLSHRDLDRDGLPEVLVGAGWDINETAKGGSLFLLHRTERKNPESEWSIKKILDDEPTLHRIHWADPVGDGVAELIVVPLKGRNSTPPYYKDKSARLLRLTAPDDPFDSPWGVEVIDEGRLQIAHGVTSVDWNKDGKEAILVAALSGINQFAPKPEGGWAWNMVTVGNPEPFPKCGAGEIQVGNHDRGELLLGTIEPWHGHQAVVYTRKRDFDDPIGRFRQWNRHVVDDSLFGGHAAEWADLDGDGLDELVVGYREPSKRDGKPGLNAYRITLAWDDTSPDPRFSSIRQIIDRDVAVEAVAVGDLDGDGKNDLAAIGRSTRNLRIYVNTGRVFP